ncbi:MAG: glycoside hydrolase, partial [Actinomycetota bacterium]|nr:glycoside hydrolase [Actinomycetota bacterium]
ARPADHQGRPVQPEAGLRRLSGELRALLAGRLGVPAGEVLLLFSTSTDGGKTFSSQSIYTAAPGKSGDEYTVLLGISTAVDPKTDDLYVTWEDSARPVPAVLFMRSSEKGVTWSQPMKINDVDPGRQWLQRDGAGGVGGAERSHRRGLARLPQTTTRSSPAPVRRTRCRTSTCRSPNMRVTDRSIDRRLSDVWFTGVRSAVGLYSMDGGA